MDNVRIVTYRDRIRTVARRYKRQMRYSLDSKDPGISRIYRELKEMNVETVSKETVDSILGNSSWTDLYCSHCFELQEKVIKFEGCYLQFCAKCLRKATSLIE